MTNDVTHKKNFLNSVSEKLGMNMSDNIEDNETAKIANVIEKILKKGNSNIKVEEVEVCPECQPTGNFVSEVSRVKVKGKKKSKGIVSDLEKPFILKKLPLPDSPSHIFHDCAKLFNNEIVAYENILPKMQNYLNRLPVNVAEKLSFPLYYGHFEKRFLLFQDLQEEGYRVVDLLKGYDAEECNSILEHLAKFHAVSFALKFTNRTKLEYMTQEMEETIFQSKNEWRDKMIPLWNLSLLLALKSLRDSKDPKLLTHGKVLEHFSGKVFLEMMYRIAENFFPTQVFCHGDLWTNNILLKYDESLGRSISVKFIDLQGMRYSSCALDVVQFLFTSANPQKDFVKFFRHYYRALEKHLVNMNEAPPFTMDDFLEEIQRKLIFGLFYAFLLFTTMTNEPLPHGDDLSWNHPKVFEKVYKGLKAEYHERVRGLVLAIIESELIYQ